MNNSTATHRLSQVHSLKVTLLSRVSQKKVSIKNFNSDILITLRQRLHGTESVWNRYEIVTDKPCVYTDKVDPVRIGSAIWYQMGPLMKVILCGTVPFQFRTGPE